MKVARKYLVRRIFVISLCIALLLALASPVFAIAKTTLKLAIINFQKSIVISDGADIGWYPDTVNAYDELMADREALKNDPNWVIASFSKQIYVVRAIVRVAIFLIISFIFDVLIYTLKVQYKDFKKSKLYFKLHYHWWNFKTTIISRIWKHSQKYKRYVRNFKKSHS